MPYLIDTNIAIHAMDGVECVVAKCIAHAGETMISVLSVVELHRGLYRSKADVAAVRMRLDLFLQRIPTISFDMRAADCYSRLIAQLGWARGRDFDRLIAAHAIASEAILVTANTADFRDIPGLKLENWAAA